MEFFYKAGKFETTKHWNRPNIRSILSFFNQVLSETNILNKYEFTIYGGVMYKNLYHTWDLDINISSNSVPDPNEIENDFLIIQKIGDDNNLLIDVNWSSIPTYKTLDIDINKDNYLELDLDSDHIKIGFVKKIINGEVVWLDDLRTEENQYGEYLIKRKLKDIVVKSINDKKWFKRENSNRVKNRYLTAQQIIDGDYSALTEESNKII